MNNSTPGPEDSTTRVLAIIGDPVKQVKSPATFGEYFKQCGINAVMIPLHVKKHEFAQVLAGLRAIKNFGGAIVTIPHKHLAFAAAHIKGEMAIKTSAANVLAPVGEGQWAADMFDGTGLINALKQRNIPIQGLRTMLIGAGGAGTAIGVALKERGHVGSLSIVEPDRKRAERLAARLGDAEIVAPDPSGYQLVVNASPVGMGTTDSPVDAARLSPETIVCDAIMDPPKTEFLQRAEHRGCTIVEGKEMLLGQVEPIVRFFGLQDQHIPAE